MSRPPFLAETGRGLGYIRAASRGSAKLVHLTRGRAEVTGHGGGVREQEEDQKRGALRPATPRERENVEARDESAVGNHEDGRARHHEEREESAQRGAPEELSCTGKDDGQECLSEGSAACRVPSLPGEQNFRELQRLEILHGLETGLAERPLLHPLH